VHSKEAKACITIPVYQKISDACEIISIKQGLEIFKSHEITFICPESFDLALLDEFKNLHSNITFEKFDDAYFKSTLSYNRLLLNSDFYQRFSKYEFMLIYQPDAYVFSDLLHYWCDKGFDYVGAPWFKKFDTSGKEKKFITNAGNGGFSLRNVAKINKLMQEKLSLKQMIKLRKILSQSRTISNKNIIFTIGFFASFFNKTNSFNNICNYICNNTNPPNEDYFLATTFPALFPEFNVAKANEAIAFSFEAQPENLYQMNGEKLPFGCHAFAKYSPDFWKKFINF
jgi:hypothetical protein